MEDKFQQKKINHIFHYTKRYEWLKSILRNGFAPSYCLEEIDESEILVPMVSFCNIPIKEVDNYMRYGKYGIGMSLEWAIKNHISPVIYIHSTTPFKKIGSSSYKFSFNQFVKKTIHETIRKETDNEVNNWDYPISQDEINEINRNYFDIVQFFKNWKTKYKGKEIITYQEREWRFIPTLDQEDGNRLIGPKSKLFQQYLDGKFKKPHLPDNSLEIKNIEDLRYIIVKEDKQREEIIELLEKKFSSHKLRNAIISGKLLILKESQLHNDF